ncbi:MAG: hypothetical protein LKI25_06080 [Atopobiaceae bacterium]|jgi:hypothetical protein|nr:hypothetical protein [Atopobiaceae bacterium]MCI2173765.1 hypothetical protein [Atopobiaceae bacterium]MCI2207593.1 hypothetical protein [Atopobiaceae bacterium]
MSDESKDANDLDESQATTDQTEDAPEDEEALFSVKYDLDSLMVEEASSLLGGGSTKNTGYLISATILLALIFYLTIGTPDNTIAVIGALLAAGFWTLGAKWRTVQLRRLHKCGLDPVISTKEQNRREVLVYGYTLALVDGTGAREEMPIASIKKIRTSDRICLLQLAGGRFVIIPHSAMSLTRYKGLVSYLEEKAS